MQVKPEHNVHYLIGRFIGRIIFVTDALTHHRQRDVDYQIIGMQLFDDLDALGAEYPTTLRADMRETLDRIDELHDEMSARYDHLHDLIRALEKLANEKLGAYTEDR